MDNVRAEIEYICTLFEKQVQVQYDLRDQLIVLKAAAARLGLYDAADYLDRSINGTNRST